MTEVLFSFDTEDYTNPGADDAVLRLARLLGEEGVRGCFNIVAVLARALAERGRTDILAALRPHEIGYHGYDHSWHPNMVEYTDVEDWDEGYRRFLEKEGRGLRIVRDIFERDEIFAFVPPGNSITSQAIWGFRELGVPLCSGSLFKGTEGRGVWYCGALNLENNCYIDDILLAEGAGGIRRRLDEYAGWKRVVVCCHPNIIHYEEFWDALNMKGKNRVEWGKWILPAPRPAAAVERFYADFREAVRLFRDDGRFEIVTYGDIRARTRDRERRRLPLPRLLELAERMRRGVFRPEKDADFSPADLFFAAAHYLAGGGAGGAAYGTEPALGPLREPSGVPRPVEVAAEQLRAAARELAGCGRVPHEIALAPCGGGGYAGPIGPRDFLDAACRVLAGAERAVLRPQAQLPDIAGFYRLDEFKLKNTWMHADDFEDRWVSRRLKWQSWTIRGE